MNGKGDRNRVSNWDKFYEGYNRVFRPQEPFYTDIKEYESRFRGGNIDSTKVGVTVSPVTVSPPSDVGANPTSSTIEKKPFKSDPIKHDITRII
jgi:hypothetical protein